MSDKNRLEIYGLKEDEIRFLKDLAEKENKTLSQKTSELLRSYIEGTLEINLAARVEQRLSQYLIDAKKDYTHILRMNEDLLAKGSLYAYLCWWAVKKNLDQPVRKELFSRAARKMRLPIEELAKEEEQDLGETEKPTPGHTDKPKIDFNIFGRKKNTDKEQGG